MWNRRDRERRRHEIHDGTLGSGAHHRPGARDTTRGGRRLPNGDDGAAGGSVGDPAAAIAGARRDHDGGLPSETLSHLVAAYGSRYRDVLEIAAAWCSRVAQDSPVIGAELVWAVRKEMAVTLKDAVVRRTPLGALGYPGAAAAARAASIVGAELGWSAERQREEIAGLRALIPGNRKRMAMGSWAVVTLGLAALTAYQ